MFVVVTEIGPTTVNVQVMDSCWNVYEDINVENEKAKEVIDNFKKEYQLE